MDIRVLGSCSGTEPYPGRRHTSLLFDLGGKLFFFDAGEGCSHTAHNLGYDLTAARAIFISHPHMDHVGGLGNLLWTVRKLRYYRDRPIGHTIDIFLPHGGTYRGVLDVLRLSEGGYEVDYEVADHVIPGPGVIYDQYGLRVSVLQNAHLPAPLSYSYLIEAEGKRVVFSGDVKQPGELDPFLAGGCDLLLHETGHHAPTDVAAHAKAMGAGRLVFVHHGRTILHDPAGQLAAVRGVFGPGADIADDGSLYTL